MGDGTEDAIGQREHEAHLGERQGVFGGDGLDPSLCELGAAGSADFDAVQVVVGPAEEMVDDPAAHLSAGPEERELDHVKRGSAGAWSAWRVSGLWGGRTPEASSERGRQLDDSDRRRPGQASSSWISSQLSDSAKASSPDTTPRITSRFRSWSREDFLRPRRAR